MPTSLALLLFCSTSFAAAPPYYRGYTDGHGRYLVARGNAVFWGSDKQLEALATQQFSSLPDGLSFTFSASGGDSGLFQHDKQTIALRCGSRAIPYSELDKPALDRLRSTARFQNASASPKPMLLGMIGDTQEFVFLAATPQPGSSHPKLQLFVGPARKLAAVPAYPQFNPSETVINSKELRVTIQPGSQGSGVYVRYRKRDYALGYLKTEPDNLLPVLGEKLYAELFERKLRSPCD